MKKTIFFFIMIYALEIVAQGYGDMYIVNNTASQTVSGWTVVEKFSSSNVSNFTYSSVPNNLTASVSGNYLIKFSLSFSGSATGIYSAGVSINGQDPSIILSSRSISVGGDVGNISFSGLVSLAVGNTVSIKILPPSSTTITVASANLVAVNLSNISDYNEFGEMNIYNGSTSQSVPNGSFTELTGFSQGDLEGFTFANGKDLALAGSDGTYLVSLAMSYSATNNTIYKTGILKNGADLTKIQFDRKIGNSTDVGNGAAFGIVTLTSGDILSISAQSDGNNKDMVIKYATLSLIKISGAITEDETESYATLEINSTSSPFTLPLATDVQITGMSEGATNTSLWSYSSNSISPTGVSAGVYQISYSASFALSDAGNILLKVYKNGSEEQNATTQRKLGGRSDRASVSGEAIISISSASDVITFNALDPELGGEELTFEKFRLVMNRLQKTSDSPLPVELTTFSADVSSNSVMLNWETATEVNNYGFEIEKHASTPLSMTDHFIPSGDEGWEKIGFVEGHGNSNSPKPYSYTDNALNESGEYSYRLKQIDIDGTFEYSDEVEVTIGAPNNFELAQNYPNPFNPTTSISYSIPSDRHITLSIYDILGNEVSILESGFKAAGNYSHTFDASDLSSGMYFYTIRSGNFVQTKKMLLMK